MSLIDRFLASNGEPIDVDGTKAYWTYWIPAVNDMVIVLHFVNFVRAPVQALSLYGEGCKLESYGQESAAMIFWTDIPPTVNEVRLKRVKRGGRVGIFNAWRDPKYGHTMQRSNNAAMRVEQRADGVRLRCSDGWGDPTFDDLVVDVSVRPRESLLK